MIRTINNKIILNKNDEGIILFELNSDSEKIYFSENDKIRFLVFEIDSYNNKIVKINKEVTAINCKYIEIPIITKQELICLLVL